ncbi:MAG TPA: adenylate/guanylate cyclase domain-containing protein [Geobacter sp.]|nr:adenylate/guanylate cyclase domain-containing protein [Geobacter sp.]HCE68259.1 adenylate/guanylate cyclase domain-containing protein [Geobacter sp.]
MAMRSFRLTLVQKMVLSFALSGLCLLTALSYAISGLGAMHKMEQEIADKDLRAATITIRLRELMVAQERLSGRFRILKHPEYKSLHDQNDQDFRRELKILKAVHDSTAVTELEKGYESYSLLAKRLFGGDPSGSAKMKKNIDAVLDTINIISEDQRKDLSDKLALSDIQEEHTVAWSLGLAFAGVVFSFLIAGWMVYSFASSIGKLQHATHLIASGDFDHDPRIESGDEIGALSQDFRSMAIRLKELEQLSLDASPLTRLPGNIAIERVINRHLRDKITFTMCYLDLDNFKSYNDRYGYIKASEVLKEVGKVIYDTVKGLGNQDAFVGHIGGDDFVVVISAEKAEAACRAIIASVDALVPSYYSEEDQRAGAIEGVDRYGVARRFPLISISIAALVCKPGDYDTAAEIASAAAFVKDRVKESVGSNYVIVREGRACEA